MVRLDVDPACRPLPPCDACVGTLGRMSRLCPVPPPAVREHTPGPCARGAPAVVRRPSARASPLARGAGQRRFGQSHTPVRTPHTRDTCVVSLALRCPIAVATVDARAATNRTARAAARRGAQGRAGARRVRAGARRGAQGRARAEPDADRESSGTRAALIFQAHATDTNEQVQPLTHSRITLGWHVEDSATDASV